MDPSKRSRVRAERSRKVERKSGRTLEIYSVAQSRFRPPPGARQVCMCCMQLFARSPFPTIALQSTSSASFSFLFFFLHPFYDCIKLKSTQPLAALCTDSLHSTPSIYLGHRKNTRSTTKVTSRSLVEHSKVQGVEEIEKKKKKTVNIAVNAFEEPACAQR